MRWLACLLSAAAMPASAQPTTSPALLPAPAQLTVREGGFALSLATALVATDPDTRAAAARFAQLMRLQQLSLPAPIADSRQRIAIRFVRTPGLPPEGYRLVTGEDGATVTASDAAGLLHGATTLWQLATQPRRPGQIAAVTIDDRPRFAWRGLMLDSARHYQTPAFIRRLLDAMASIKLNTLHWHLVDDQGWRIEIPKYPRLTQVTAWRRPATAPGAPLLPPVGGFYTQVEIRALVAYAAARGITIVPEIELPGHALSAIRAYPKLGMGVPIPPGTESDWGVFPWLYNTDEATFAFLRDVLDQVMALFPSRYIHVGGDEAVKDQWKASPAIQAQLKQLGLKSEDALQGWFVHRIGDYLAAHGRKLVGWDEILDGGITPGATVMSWRGIDGAVAAAKAGHDAILSPAPLLYFDNRQGVDALEGTGRGNLITLADVYAFDPVPAALPSDQRRHILGLQGNVWTEHLRRQDQAAAAAFPRAAAIAELGWSSSGARDYPDFVRRLAPQFDRWHRLGITASTAAFRPVVTVSPAGDAARVALASQADVTLRYTTDGTAPDARAKAYTAPLTIPFGTRLRAATFSGDRPLSGAIDLVPTAASARRRDDTQLTLCSSGIALRLADDAPAAEPRAAFLLDIANPCWRYDRAPMDGVRRIALTVGQLPFNFQIGRDVDKIKFRPPATPAGEFEVRDGCTGPRIAVLPLAPAADHPATTVLTAPLAPLTGAHDLCLTYTAAGVNPLWAVSAVQLLTAP